MEYDKACIIPVHENFILDRTMYLSGMAFYFRMRAVLVNVSQTI